MNALLKIATITNLIAEIGDCDEIQLTLDDIIKNLTNFQKVEEQEELVCCYYCDKSGGEGEWCEDKKVCSDCIDKHKCDKCELFYDDITELWVREGMFCKECYLFETCEYLEQDVNEYLTYMDSNTEEKLNLLNDIKELIAKKYNKK